MILKNIAKWYMVHRPPRAAGASLQKQRRTLA